MDKKRFEICVERMNRIQICLVCLAVILGAYEISALWENTIGIKVKGEVVLLLFFWGICILSKKLEGWFPSTEMLEAVFGEDKVIFARGKKKRDIYYKDIKEVEKTMIINRYHLEKGYYRVKIKTSGMAYTIYSGEDTGKCLDFAEVGVAEVYHEFQVRGIKCC